MTSWAVLTSVLVTFLTHVSFILRHPFSVLRTESSQKLMFRLIRFKYARNCKEKADRTAKKLSVAVEAMMTTCLLCYGTVHRVTIADVGEYYWSLESFVVVYCSVYYSCCLRSAYRSNRRRYSRRTEMIWPVFLRERDQ